jgi:type II secretion system protein J
MRPARAFTLLELLVAIVIFTAVAGAAYALFESGRGLSSRAEVRAELFQSARAALRTIEDDLKGAVMTGSAFDAGLIGTSGGTESLPLDRVEAFAVNSTVVSLDTPEERNPERRIDLSRVTYWIDDGSATKSGGLARERLSQLTAPTVRTRTGGTVEEVAPEVVSLDLRYYDTDWQGSWDSTRENKLPRAVEITVRVRGEWRGQEVIESFTSRFYLPVAAETPERQP